MVGRLPGRGFRCTITRGSTSPATRALLSRTIIRLRRGRRSYCVRAGEPVPAHPQSGVLRFMDTRPGADGCLVIANRRLGQPLRCRRARSGSRRGRSSCSPPSCFDEVAPLLRAGHPQHGRDQLLVYRKSHVVPRRRPVRRSSPPPSHVWRFCNRRNHRVFPSRQARIDQEGRPEAGWQQRKSVL